VDREIWIEDGAKPIPRKLQITCKQLPGSPRYVNMVTHWDSAHPPASSFLLSIPPGAVKTNMLPADAATEQAGG
jgi:hypothetical protein